MAIDQNKPQTTKQVIVGQVNLLDGLRQQRMLVNFTRGKYANATAFSCIPD